VQSGISLIGKLRGTCNSRLQYRAHNPDSHWLEELLTGHLAVESLCLLVLHIVRIVGTSTSGTCAATDYWTPSPGLSGSTRDGVTGYQLLHPYPLMFGPDLAVLHRVLHGVEATRACSISVTECAADGGLFRTHL
jgi:hypothetical protein